MEFKRLYMARGQNSSDTNQIKPPFLNCSHLAITQKDVLLKILKLTLSRIDSYKIMYMHLPQIDLCHSYCTDTLKP